MDRIFQDYEGDVPELEGSKFTIVKSLIDDVDKDIYLLWLYDELSGSWYRIFIDGLYCGIDRYPHDQSCNDEDDDISWADHSGWFRGKTLLSATVNFDGRTNGEITLRMKFDKGSFKLICKFEAGNSRLEFA